MAKLSRRVAIPTIMALAGCETQSFVLVVAFALPIVVLLTAALRRYWPGENAAAFLRVEVAMDKLVRMVHSTAISAMCAVLAAGASTASAAPGGNSYAAAMATAKQKAAAKDYPAAIAAYQAALAAQHNDATALSELSWVSFLAGDYAAAERTGVLPAASAEQPALRAMAWFNAGHAEEAQGKLRSARASYERSLALRDNADVKHRLAGVTAALLAPHALLGPFATPKAFCAEQKLTAEQCQPRPRYDDNGHESGFEVAAIAGQPTGGSFNGVAMIEAEGPIAGDFPMMDLAIQVGTASWCGSVNEGAGPPDFFMSLGANGQFETDSQRSFSSSVNVEGNGKIYKGGGGVSAGNTTDSVKIQAYWVRIDVRANGSYELRGGLNG